MTYFATESLSKSFGDLVAVDSVDLEIDEDEVHAIIGPNGAGKTTLFNLIVGEFPISSGEVIYEGEPITNLKTHEIASRGIARSFQTPSVFEELTVEENVASMQYIDLEGRLPVFSTTDAYNRVWDRTDETLSKVELDDKKDLKAKNLSHGDKRLLDIALTIARDADLLLLDEPTAGLSEDEVNSLVELLSDIREDYTIVLIEHNIDFILDLADRISVLNEGKLVKTGEPLEMRQDSRVQEIYFGGEHA